MNTIKKIDYSPDDCDSEKLLISALEEKINLSFEQRIESHENARRLVDQLFQAGEDYRARSKQAS